MNNSYSPPKAWMRKIAYMAQLCFCFLVVQVWFSLPSHVIMGRHDETRATVAWLA